MIDDDRSVLGRGLAILEAFGLGDEWLSLREVIRRTGLAKSTAHRMCHVLVRLGYLSAHDGHFRTTEKLYFMGARTSPLRHLSDVTLPWAFELRHRTQQTVHVGVLWEGAVLHLHVVRESPEDLMVDPPSTVLPAYCTSGGKAILAYSRSDEVEQVFERGLHPFTKYTIVRPNLLRDHLKRVADDGIAYVDEEYRLGVNAVAAPILVKERPVAEISISGNRMPKFYRAVAREVTSAASGISAELARHAVFASVS